MLEAAQRKKAQAAELRIFQEVEQKKQEARIARAAIQAQINAVQEKNADAIRAATEAAKAKAVSSANAKKAAELEAEAKQTAVVVQKNVQAAIDELNKKQKEKEEREAAEDKAAREKKEAERLERIRIFREE